VHLGDFLRETDAPPVVRAAIYKSAALIPGIRLLGWVRDRDGRRGLGVAHTSHRSTSELIFDPRTGELLGEQGTGPTGTLQYWAVYLRERILNRLPGRPPRGHYMLTLTEHLRHSTITSRQQVTLA
jgi:hypothetical protein